MFPIHQEVSQVLYTYELTKLSVLVYESGTPFPILQRVCCSPERTRLLSGRVWTWAQSLPKANTLHRHAVEHRCGAPLWSTTLHWCATQEPQR